MDADRNCTKVAQRKRYYFTNSTVVNPFKTLSRGTLHELLNKLQAMLNTGYYQLSDYKGRTMFVASTHTHTLHCIPTHSSITLIHFPLTTFLTALPITSSYNMPSGKGACQMVLLILIASTSGLSSALARNRKRLNLTSTQKNSRTSSRTLVCTFL